MLTKYVLTALASFSASLLLVLLLKKYSLKYNLLFSGGVPAVGGIALGLGFYLACLAVFLRAKGLSAQVTGVLFSSFVMLAVGIIDDKRELSVAAKFLTQLFCVFLLISFGVKTQIAGLGSWLNLGLTFIWVLGITNAFNHLDVMDGVAGGTAVIAAAGLAIISFLSADTNMLLLFLSLIGAASGFLIFNLPPAKVYLGNSGSHFLGFILGSSALVLSYAPPERKIALLSPVAVLGFAAFDTIFVIWMRLSKGLSAFRKSADHLALRFLKMGHSKPKALFHMLLLALFFSLSGVTLSRLDNSRGIILAGFTAITGLVVAVKMAEVKVDE